MGRWVKEVLNKDRLLSLQDQECQHGQLEEDQNLDRTDTSQAQASGCFDFPGEHNSRPA